MRKKGIVVAVDGPAGSGKSTICKMLSRKLDLLYLDTGAMYRAIAYKATSEFESLPDDDGLEEMLAGTEIEVEQAENGMQVILDSVRLGEELRTPEMSMMASRVSARSEVRRFLTRRQQEIGAQGGVVAEGRDAGTVIFPNADFKFYLDADIVTRACRRNKELSESGVNEDRNETLDKMAKRDHNDSNRDLAPRPRAEDAILVDTTDKSIAGVLDTILGHIYKGIEAEKPRTGNKGDVIGEREG